MTGIDWSNCPIVERDPEKMGGIPTLRAWRLGVDSLVENHDYGVTTEKIAEWFGVPLEDLEIILAYAQRARGSGEMRVANQPTESNSFSTTAHLSEQSLGFLRGLLNLPIHTIHAPCLQVAKQHFTAPSLSLLIGQREWLTFSCEWLEAPRTYNDYWQLTISKQDRPAGIQTDATGAIIAPCTIKFFEAPRITEIEVYATRLDWEGEAGSEHIAYDSFLRFRREGGREFCIGSQLNGPGIATEVHFSEDEETIRGLLSGAALRLTL